MRKPHPGDNPVCAMELKADNVVMVGRSPVRLVEVRHFIEETEVVELCFENDALVEALPLPLEGSIPAATG